MMIELVAQNSHGTVKLFHKYEAYHLVDKFHFINDIFSLTLAFTASEKP